MCWHMGGCHRLAGSTGSRAGRIIPLDITGCSMGVKGSSPHIRHPEHPATDPLPECFNRSPGTRVSRISFFKEGEGSLCTISSPECKDPMVNANGKIHNRFVKAAHCHLPSLHGINTLLPDGNRQHHIIIPRVKNLTQELSGGRNNGYPLPGPLSIIIFREIRR